MIEGRRRNYLLAIIVLALLLFNAPLLIVIDEVGGGGFLPAYLFIGWAVVILLTAWTMQGRIKR